MRRFLVPSVLLAFAAVSYGQIHLGLTSDFQDGTLQGWAGADGLLTNISTGGPAGTGDRYLQVVSVGGSGPGSKLATYNGFPWGGNYQAAGVTSVNVMLNNFSAQELQMRICMFDAITSARWTSTTPLLLAANSGWVSASFSLDESALTRVLGSSSYASMIANVSQIMIRHDANAPSAGGTSVVATIGIDNVTAVPEPATVGALTVGLVALLRRKRR